MLRTILAFCGYVKVPKAAVEMSMLIEDDYKKLAIVVNNKVPELKGHLEQRQKALHILTRFLQSGRMLGL